MLGSRGARYNRDFLDEGDASPRPVRYNTSTDYSRDRSGELVIKEKEMLIDNPDFFCELRGDVPKPGEYKIFIIEPALKTLWTHAKEGLPEGVAGLLLGGLYHDHEMGEDYVEIHYAFPSASSFNEEMNLRLANRVIAEMEKVSLRSYPNETVVGWYHTHPGTGIFFSENDTLIHETFYPEISNIALILDPLMEIDPLRETYKNIAFFYRKEKNLEKSSGYFAYKQRCAESISPIDKLRERYHKKRSRPRSSVVVEISTDNNGDERSEKVYGYSDDEDNRDYKRGSTLRGLKPSPAGRKKTENSSSPFSRKRKLRRTIELDEDYGEFPEEQPLLEEREDYDKKDFSPKEFIPQSRRAYRDYGDDEYLSEGDERKTGSGSLYIEFEEPEEQEENHYSYRQEFYGRYEQEENPEGRHRAGQPSRASRRARDMIMRKSSPSFTGPSPGNSKDEYYEEEFTSSRGVFSAAEERESYCKEEQMAPGRETVELRETKKSLFTKKSNSRGGLSSEYKEAHSGKKDGGPYQPRRLSAARDKADERRSPFLRKATPYRTSHPGYDEEHYYSQEQDYPAPVPQGGGREKKPSFRRKAPALSGTAPQYDEGYELSGDSRKKGISTRKNLSYSRETSGYSEEDYREDIPLQLPEESEPYEREVFERRLSKRPGSGELQRVFPEVKYAAQPEESVRQNYGMENESFHPGNDGDRIYEETYYNQGLSNTRVLGGRTWKRQQKQRLKDPGEFKTGRRRKSGLLKANKYKYYGGRPEDGEGEEPQENTTEDEE